MPTASSVAIAQGWLAREFEADGIAVRSLGAASGRDDRLAHYRHDHPALFREGGVVPPLWAAGSGARTRLLGIGWEEQFRGLVVGPDSKVKNPEDLRGRRIAVPRKTEYPIDFDRALALYGIRDCLQAAGVDGSEVVLVDVSAPEASQPVRAQSAGDRSESIYDIWSTVGSQRAELLALVRGEVDAVYVAGGLGLQLMALVGAAVVIEVTGGGAWGDWSGNHLRVFTVSEELLQQRPDLVRRYAGTLQRAAEWATAHERESLRIIAAELGLAEAWVPLGYHPDTARHLQLELSDDALSALSDRAKFLFDRGFLEQPVNLETWSDPSVLSDLVTVTATS
jgi:ABC-type nitrate/sulfonate/bicarbonate transport system substrate-binding protein